MSNEVKRFSLVSCIRDGEEWTGLQRHTDGTYMTFYDHERIVAEKDAEIERLELVAMAAAESIKEKYKILDTQKRVIEKLKVINRDFAWHYDECSSIVEDNAPCDCGLRKTRTEIATIEKVEA